MYIHPRYVVFALVMAIFGGTLLVVGAIWQPPGHKPPVRKRVSVIDIIVVLVLVAAFMLSPRALSTAAVERKTVTTSSSADSPASRPCPDFRPETMEMWVYAASEYPHCYEGKDITLTGFVYQPSDNPLPEDMYYLGRVVMSCCVIDARPYALPIKQGAFERYPKDTWLTITGKLERVQINGASHLAVSPLTVQQVGSPDKPYEYLNSEPMQLMTPLPSVGP